MNQPLVSIIIPVYNTGKFITETLSSIVRQTYTNWECIVVDDGSTDNSLALMQEIAEAEPRIIVHQRPTHMAGGGNAARNFGFEMSRGEFINWFDSDDVMVEGFISEKVQLIGSGTNLIITSGYFTTEDLVERKPITLYETTEIFREYVMWRLKILTPSIMFRRSFLQNRELFSTTIRKGQEFEFFSRVFHGIKETEYTIKNVHTFLYRSHAASTTHQNQAYNRVFKQSEAYTLSQNLKRAIEKNDKELVESMYRMLVNQLFKALQNKHHENVLFIIEVLQASLYKENKVLITVISKVSSLHAAINLNFVRWDKIAKKMSLRI